MIRFIYQADLSGAAAATACCGVPLIWCLTSSQSGLRLGKQIYPLFLTLTQRHAISVLRALTDKGGGGRETEQEMTD